MIKVKNVELINSIKDVESLLEQKIKVGMAFKIAKAVKEINTTLESVEKIREKIVTKFTELDSKGEKVKPIGEDGKEVENSVKITDPELYSKEMQELYTIESELNVDTISITDLESANIELEPKTLLNLFWLFK